MYDITIVGAGPAGATLARLLGRDYRVLVLERRELTASKPPDFPPGVYTKACGGLIAPDAQYMLAKLGLGVPKEVLVGPQLFTVRTFDFQGRIERYYQRHYINIDREKFDRWLASLIPPQVEMRCGVMFKAFQTDDDCIRLTFQSQGREYREKTKYLIGADGARSVVRQQLRPGDFHRTYISIQEWFKVEQAQPYFSAIFDQDITDFYSWTIPKENYLLVGAALAPHDNAVAKFELLKKRLLAYGYELHARQRREGAYILRPQSSQQVVFGQGQIALIGEAAGWISPTSAEGLSYAFRSAIALAKSVQAVERDSGSLIREYRRRTGDLRMNILLKNLKAPFMYHDALRKAVLRSGILSMDME